MSFIKNSELSLEHIVNKSLFLMVVLDRQKISMFAVIPILNVPARNYLP